MRRHGFTLIELLVVMAIITILAGILVPAIAAVRNSVARQMTRALLLSIETSLANYQSEFQMDVDDVDEGKGLGNRSLYRKLSGDLDGDGQIDADASLGDVYRSFTGGEINSLKFDTAPIIDGYGQSIGYDMTFHAHSETAAFTVQESLGHADTRGAAKNNRSYDLWSVGRNGKLDSGGGKKDDIGNWP